MEITEGRLNFHFSKDCEAIKFDEDKFYRETFNALPFSKGVDIIAISSNAAALIEIKDFRGHEAENRRRILPNSKRSDTLDVEVASKVAMTIACLYGAFSKSQTTSTAKTLADYYYAFQSEDIPKCKKRIEILLFMEGDFRFQTRSKKTIMGELRKSIAAKLRWLNCTVRVVDSSTYPAKLFQLESIEG